MHWQIVQWIFVLQGAHLILLLCASLFVAGLLGSLKLFLSKLHALMLSANSYDDLLLCIIVTLILLLEYYLQIWRIV